MKMVGFTLIEVIVFIVITGLIGSSILLAFSTSMIKTSTVRQNLIATKTHANVWNGLRDSAA